MPVWVGVHLGVERGAIRTAWPTRCVAAAWCRGGLFRTGEREVSNPAVRGVEWMLFDNRYAHTCGDACIKGGGRWQLRRALVVSWQWPLCPAS